MSEKPQPLLDISSLEASRSTLRHLLGAQAVVLIATMVLGYYTRLPETLETALAIESELAPQWRLALEGFALLAMLILYVWGVAQLWQFKHAGISKYLWATFAPLFLVQAGPSVTASLVDFANTGFYVLAGMILFMCYTIPAMFAVPHHDPVTVATAVETQSGNGITRPA